MFLIFQNATSEFHIFNSFWFRKCNCQILEVLEFKKLLLRALMNYA